MNIREQTRLRTISQNSHTSDWLKAPPITNLGLSIPHAEFLVATRVWLGIPFFSSTPPPRCFCGVPLDPTGDHLLGCGHSPLRIRRHDALRDILFQVLSQDNSSTRREQRIQGDSQDRPGDIFHPDFSSGNPTYFDVSIRNTLQSSRFHVSSTSAGAVGAAGEALKDARHAANVASVGGVFIPVVVESLGLWTPFATRIISQIASRTIIHNGLTSKQAQKNLFQQLSVKLWCYNAKMILHFMAATPRSSICDSPND